MYPSYGAFLGSIRLGGGCGGRSRACRVDEGAGLVHFAMSPLRVSIPCHATTSNPLQGLVQVVGSVLVTWYVGGLVAAMIQEFKVRWPRPDRKLRVAVFIGAMEVVGTLHTVISFAAHKVQGVVKGRLTAFKLMSSFYRWFGPFLFGPIEVEGFENLPPR